MECNKEEAMKAKVMAETKMQNKDYFGARRNALKAQQLYPHLENLSQLIMVCDVHLSAEAKAYGNEKDWYGILKVESTADEATIKKQYRKFALLLHPDKNKFAGASDAFKLIGEAQRVLLDPGRRRLHDDKVKGRRPNWAPAQQSQQQGSNNPNIRTHPWTQGKTTSPFTSFNPQQQQSPKQAQPTFWTMCPFCAVKYQYYRDVVNKVVWCQRCKKSFIGQEIKGQATMNYAPPRQPGPGVSKPYNCEKVGSQKNASNGTQTGETVAKTGTSEVGRDTKVKSKFSAKLNSKRKRQMEEWSESGDSDSNIESCDSDSSNETEEDEEIIVEENGDVKAKQDFRCFSENLRRSTRSKVNVSYKENYLSDDDEFRSSSKKAKSSATPRASEDPIFKKEAPTSNNYEGSSPMHVEEDDLDTVKQKESERGKDDLNAAEDGVKSSFMASGGISPDSGSDGSTIPDVYDYPDPDFNDFDKYRTNECFAVGQIWAAYDTLDAMPRFYARIKKVISLSNFKLMITWLEPDPDDEDEVKWVDDGLPFSCGKLRHGNTEFTDNRLMFSQSVDWEKGSKRDTYKIYPRKGETWALFKSWDMSWHSASETKRKFDFEFVEILSDYSEDNGVSVAYLGKLKGFSCVFCRTVKGGVDSFQIPRNQLLRFSHRVPSFQLSGEDRDNVPKNSFELDPASLPAKIEEIDSPKGLHVNLEKVEKDQGNLSRHKEREKTVFDSEGNGNSRVESDPDIPSRPVAFEIPEPEFFNFDAEKSPEKFRLGQFWALYSDEDGLPKYYGFIKKIDIRPEFRLRITWLNACPSKNTIKYADKRIPIGCGMFKHNSKDSTSYSDHRTFSHQLRVEPTDKRDIYAIYPRKGEVWALYKNWNPKMMLSDLGKCEYNMVEVLEENDFDIKVVLLEMVNGYNSVFKARMTNGSPATTLVVRDQLLKFSHQIPAFRLTNERGGSLKGFWELDPAALPIKMFRSS